jgi:hypothetical protein
VLRGRIRVLSQALMEDEGHGPVIGAERHERTGDRTAYRNGGRTRTWDTRVGTIELAIPKVTPGSYFPSRLQPRRQADLPDGAAGPRGLLVVRQEIQRQCPCRTCLAPGGSPRVGRGASDDPQFSTDCLLNARRYPDSTAPSLRLPPVSTSQPSQMSEP